MQNIENLKNKTYTITELETYAECAFRYFAKNIAKISPEITFDKTLSSLETGNYLHSILYKFYSYYCNLSQNFLYEFKYFDVDDKDKPIYLNKLLEIANNEIKPVDIPIYQYEIEKIVGKNGKLEFWINNEIEKLKQWNFSSILFEYSFGMKNSPIELKNSYGKCIKIRGKIDRIELYNFKQNDNKIYFVVADYKTSATSIPSANQIKDGKSLQVPIYLKIMQNIFENKNFQPAGGVYYNLASELNSHKDFYKTPIKICFPEGTDEKQGEFLQLLENSVDYAINYKEKIENLFFAPNETNACKYCEYSRICRIKEKKYNLQK